MGLFNRKNRGSDDEMDFFDKISKGSGEILILDSMDQYYQECSSELESATSHDDLLRAWHSFDFSRLTYEHRDLLSQQFDEIRDRIRGYSLDLSSDYKLANFCHGGDLDED